VHARAEEPREIGRRHDAAAREDVDAQTGCDVLRHNRIGLLWRGGQTEDRQIELADLAQRRLRRDILRAEKRREREQRERPAKLSV